MEKKIIQVDEKVPVKMLIPLSLQHMFAMFGASVLVPFLFGISPAIVLLMNGVGTLVFIVVTKGKAPAYLGSSFAFLVPAGLVIEKFGYQYALGSFVAIGFGGIIVALIIRKFGSCFYRTSVRNGLDRYRAADSSHGTGCSPHRAGACGKCRKQCRPAG